MNICMLLKKKRRENGLRQIDVAKYLGFQSKNGYWSIENGFTKLKAEHLLLLCELYGVTADYFLSSPVQMFHNMKY